MLGACRDDRNEGAGIADTNSVPVIEGAPKTTAVVGETYEFVPDATDVDGDTLTFAIENRPGWASFSPSTGRLAGQPPASAAARVFADVRISVSDGKAVAELPAYDIEVEGDPAANTPPSISGSPGTTAIVGNTYGFTPDASDAEGDALTFSIANRPSWAAFDASTGAIYGTPADRDARTHAGIVISVSDGTASRSLPAFDITVSAGAPPPPVNRPPVIGGSPAMSATVGVPYSFQPTASDPDDEALSFSISGKPGWANFSTSTGRLSGIPGSGAIGEHQGIVISVSDGAARASLGPFTITVSAAAPPNRAPVIGGSPPPSVVIGQPYDFRPSANDADNDALRFTIANKPRWASFSTASGRLSGTPEAGEAGTYGNIRITVSDGTVSASLTFDITVEQIALGSVTLSWTPPTQNEDGTPLDNLRGFRVYYGTSSSALSSMVSIPNAGVTTAVVENLPPATWYFGVKAYTTEGVESDFSNIASKRID